MTFAAFLNATGAWATLAVVAWAVGAYVLVPFVRWVALGLLDCWEGVAFERGERRRRAVMRDMTYDRTTPRRFLTPAMPVLDPEEAERVRSEIEHAVSMTARRAEHERELAEFDRMLYPTRGAREPRRSAV